MKIIIKKYVGIATIAFIGIGGFTSLISEINGSNNVTLNAATALPLEYRVRYFDGTKQLVNSDLFPKTKAEVTPAYIKIHIPAGYELVNPSDLGTFKKEHSPVAAINERVRDIKLKKSDKHTVYFYKDATKTVPSGGQVGQGFDVKSETDVTPAWIQSHMPKGYVLSKNGEDPFVNGQALGERVKQIKVELKKAVKHIVYFYKDATKAVPSGGQIGQGFEVKSETDVTPAWIQSHMPKGYVLSKNGEDPFVNGQALGERVKQIKVELKKITPAVKPSVKSPVTPAVKPSVKSPVTPVVKPSVKSPVTPFTMETQQETPNDIYSGNVLSTPEQSVRGAVHSSEINWKVFITPILVFTSIMFVIELKKYTK